MEFFKDKLKNLSKTELEDEKLRSEIKANRLRRKLVEPAFIVTAFIGFYSAYAAYKTQFFSVKADLLEMRKLRLDSSIQVFARDSARIYDSNLILKSSNLMLIDSNSELTNIKTGLEKQISKIRKDQKDLIDNIKSKDQKLGEYISENSLLREERDKARNLYSMTFANYTREIASLKKTIRATEMEYNKLGLHAEDNLETSMKLQMCEAENENLKKELNKTDKSKKRF